MNNNTSAYIKSNLEKNTLKLIEILNNFCYISNERDVTINFKALKLINKQLSNDFLLEHIIKNIDLLLTTNNLFNVHINVKSISILDVDKNKLFIQQASLVLKERYPSKLETCYIYEAPGLFSSIYKIIFSFIDKETQKKFKFVETSTL